ncbi:hypothetical protein [Pseudoalteromonas sp. T1lg22]|uniref:hypothetical protein n=1 Tax=Pseudoalteromonas sp. T1lg22 TaxID=2077096 RepID=UPI000CF73460|nr:hypothetical protein [Pseudoalteromonas sp. T1lg22]
MLQPLFFLTFFIGTFIGFRFVLAYLRVKDEVNKRAIALTISFLAIQLTCGWVSNLLNFVEPTTLIASVILFAFILRKVLILKLWQVIAIPIVVSMISTLFMAITFMLAIRLFGPIGVN